MSTPMKRCPDCHAPNPPRLAQCHYCGADLAAPKPGTALPGQPTFPCANCEGAIPVGARACPFCGRMVPKVDPDALPQMHAGPPGWEVEPFPDGTVLLRRSGWARLTSDLSLPLALLFLFYYAGAFVFQLFLKPRMVLDLLLIPLIVFLVTLAVLVLFGREELRVGPNQLERRWRLGKWCRVKRLSDGLLVLHWNRDLWGRGYDRSFDWKLEARGHGGAVLVDCRSEHAYTGFLGELVGSAELPPPPPELVYLGEWLAERTGWNFDRPLTLGKGRWS